MEHRRWIFGYLIVVLLAASIFFTACYKKKRHAELTLSREKYDVIKMANGAAVEPLVEALPNNRTTLSTIPITDDYRLQLTLHIAIPTPATKLSDLTAATPELPQALPHLEEMITCSQGEKIPSPFFKKLFENKTKALQHQLSFLGQLFPRESLYDCQTILTLTNRKNGTRALLVQAIMNVNADGSDGDRNIPLEKLSLSYQPQTNYRWLKSTSHINPNLHEIEDQLVQAQLGMTNTSLTLDQKNKFQEQIHNKQQMLTELQRWSFLIGSADPFIVLPKFMLDSKNGEAASIGDYAIVLYQNKLYPAIVGDIGPSSKIGEASLRLCRAIDPRSGADHRPVSAPHVSYFIFPKSADLPMTAPNYAHWSDRCHQLWEALGGSKAMTWYEWTNLEQPWP